MFDKKIFAVFTLLLLVLSLFLYAVRSEFAFTSLKNPDVFKEYESTTAETAAGYGEVKLKNLEKFLVLFDSTENDSIMLKNNINRVLSDMKKEINSVDIKNFKGNFKEYSCVVIAFDKIDSFNYFEALFEYVSGGNNLIFAISPQDESKFNMIYRKLGIYEKGYAREANGIKLRTNILIRGEGIEINTDYMKYSVIPVQLDSDCIIHGVSSEGIPLIWEREYGKGKLIFTNGQVLLSKENLGLFAGMLGRLGISFIYPVINSKLVFIDDFPAPIPEGYDEKIYKEFGKNISDFCRDVWWPDMLKISKQENIKYSTYLIENYEDSVEGIATEDSHSNIRNNLIVYGREIIKSGGEIGIHGHNHQPLAMEGFIKQELGYRSWESKDKMVASIKEVYNFIKSIYPNYSLRSYVPPSNILSPEGREALKEGIPELKIISSLYIGSEEGDAYEQEFEVSKDGIVELPRLTEGYRYTDIKKWTIYSEITSYGVFSHFIHPDDVLDVERNFGDSWTKMRKDFQSIMHDVNSNFSWLKSSTVSEGGADLLRYQNANMVFKNDENNIHGYCEGFRDHMFFILRTEKKIGKQIGCTVLEIDENAYLVKAEKPEFHIGLEDRK